MGSPTKKTWVRRGIRRNKAGKAAKKERHKLSSPPFPIHPEAAAPAKSDAK